MRKYTRNAVKVLKSLERQDNGVWITKTGCYIHTPVRLEDRGLTVIGVRSYVFGICTIFLDDGTYMVTNAITRFEIDPSTTQMVTIDEVEYYEFYFEPNSVVLKSSSVVKDDKILYYVLDEFIFQAKVPWYMGYNDRLQIFLNVVKYVGLPVDGTPEIFEAMVSITARSIEDDSLFIRQKAKDYKDFDNIINVAFSSVQDSVQGTVDKITGNYFEPAITGALVSPSKRANNTEKILRY